MSKPNYRMWCKAQKKMKSVEALDFIKERAYFDTKEAIKSYYHFNDVVLMQSTGMKDFNNKEIYESDIVTVEVVILGYSNMDKDVTGIVEMSEGCWMVTNNKEKWSFDLWDETNVVKVIGNIHENKELLGEVE